MEAGDCATGNRNKQEREHRAGEYRAGTVDEFGDCRHFHFWHGENDTHRQTDNHADFQEGREVVARRQQQPHRQHRGNKAVDH